MSSHPPAPLSTSMPTEADIYSVAFEGFSEFERAALASCFRLTTRRVPAYRLIDAAGMSDFLVADADHAGTEEAVVHAQRVPDTVFIGARAPQGAVAWLPRPIDPVQIVRELDALVALRLALPENERENEHETEREGGAVDAPAPPFPAAPRKAPEATAAPAADACEVLVVEDSAIARKFLERRLQRLGYRVQTAASADAARALLAQRYFDIVFLDIVLGAPGSADGLQLCQAVRQREVAGKAPRCAVVMVTGLSGATDRVRGTLAGCDAYLAKPLGEVEFIAALRRIDPAFDARCAAAM